MRAVIYCRVSTSEQTQNLSLPTQEKACREYCARQGYDVEEVFVDAGESAKTVDRPEFRRLLELCRKQRGRLHAVVVYSLTRFSRNTTDHHAIVGLLRGLGIALRSVTEPIDDTPSGRLMEGILASMAQFDNDVRSERVVAGMKAAVDRGRWVWAAPLGYLNANARHGSSLVPDPARAPAVREAFELCASGIRGRALLDRVTALGLRTKRGNPLSSGRLYDLLRHPVYAGYLRCAGWLADRRGDFPALVSEETFARVQVQLSDAERSVKMANRHRNHPDFPLRRFITCGRCGRPFTAGWSKGRRKHYGFYFCCTPGCHRARREDVESAFVELLDTLRPRPEVWAVLRAAVLDVWHREHASAAAEQAALRRREIDLKLKLKKLEERYVYGDGGIDHRTYVEQRDELREAITQTGVAWRSAETDELDVEGAIVFAEHVFHHAGALWTSAATVEDRIKVQWALFPVGLVWDGFRTAPTSLRRRDLQEFGQRQVQVVGGSVTPFRTAVTCLQFYRLEASDFSETRMVEPLPLTLNRAGAWLRHMLALRPAA